MYTVATIIYDSVNPFELGVATEVFAVECYAFQVVSSDAFAREKLQTMRAFGADLLIVPSQGGLVTPDLTRA